MEQENLYWDNIFAKLDIGKPEYDLWLDRHLERLEPAKNTPVLDLGCGYGCDTLYLVERGFRVIACDFSQKALDSIRRYVPAAETRKVDLLQGLPFPDASAKAVIADLSLHYFYWSDTVRMIGEIGRVLHSGGVLLARLNSTDDVHYGAGKGVEVEPRYYEHKGRRKRFFDESDIRKLIEGWSIEFLEKTDMRRYGEVKRCWELAAVKR